MQFLTAVLPRLEGRRAGWAQCGGWPVEPDVWSRAANVRFSLLLHGVAYKKIKIPITVF